MLKNVKLNFGVLYKYISFWYWYELIANFEYYSIVIRQKDLIECVSYEENYKLHEPYIIGFRD